MKVFVICDEKDHFLIETLISYPSFSSVFDRTVYLTNSYEEAEQVVYRLVEQLWPAKLKICSIDITLTLEKEFNPVV